MGLRRAGQLIVEFWPSQRLFWAVWRFPQPSGATVRAFQAQAFVLMPMQRLVSANFQVYFGGAVVVASCAGSLPSIGYGAPLQVACYSLKASHAIPCFFPEGCAGPPVTARAGQTDTPRVWDGEVCILYMDCKSKSKAQGEVHRVIGTGR